MNEHLSTKPKKFISVERNPGSVRKSQRMLSRRRRKSNGWLLVTIGILTTAAMTYAIIWWNTPVENPNTGVISTKGAQLQSAISILSNPKQSLKTAFPGKTQLNVLLIGLDHVPATPGDPGVIRRCDSVIVASTDLQTKEIRLLSVPRDGWVRHWQGGEKFGYERMGHTFSLGQQYNIRHKADRDEGGIERTVDTVENLLGISVDYYAVIQFEGMVELVDTICSNGLEIDVEKDMKYSDKAGDLFIDLKKGRQKLSGKELLGYARFRKDALGDIGRMDRQQKVLKLLLQEMMKPENLKTLPRAANILNDNVQTDFTLNQLLAFAVSLDKYSEESIQTKTLMSWYNLERGKEIDIPGLSLTEARKGGYHVQGIFQKDIAVAVKFLENLDSPPDEPEANDNANNVESEN